MLLSDLLDYVYEDEIVIYSIDGDVIYSGSVDDAKKYSNPEELGIGLISGCDVLGIGINDFGQFSIDIDAEFLYNAEG